MLCSWFGKALSNSSNISIWLSRLEPGSSWTTPKEIVSVNNRNCQNPVLFKAPDTGLLWLFHTVQEVGYQDGAIIAARTSEDDGNTWSEPAFPFLERKGSLTRQPVQVLDDGTWALPVFNCNAVEGQEWKGNNDSSSVLYTRNGGKTWEASDIPSGTGAVHMSVLPHQTGASHWVALFRSRWADNIYRSTSKDGIDWAAPQHTALPNPNCGIAASRLPNGKPIIVFNRSQATSESRSQGQAREAIWGLPRKTLTVGISDDDGLSWKHRLIEDFEDQSQENGDGPKVTLELSYPSIIVDGDGVTHVAFTYHRDHIQYARSDDIEGWVDVDPTVARG